MKNDILQTHARRQCQKNVLHFVLQNIFLQVKFQSKTRLFALKETGKDAKIQDFRQKKENRQNNRKNSFSLNKKTEIALDSFVGKCYFIIQKLALDVGEC